MRKTRSFAFIAALLITLSGAGLAVASPPNQQDYHLTILSGSQLSVVIYDSNDFPQEQFSLNAPPNWTAQAYYSLEVVDMRGEGDGWNVIASATPFTPAVPGTSLHSVNNGAWVNLCPTPPIVVTTTTTDGFCAQVSGSITNGVAVTPGHAMIMTNAGVSIISSAAGISGGQPNGTGTFRTQETLYYNGFPPALAVGTYQTTVTLSISGNAP